MYVFAFLRFILLIFFSNIIVLFVLLLLLLPLLFTTAFAIFALFYNFPAIYQKHFNWLLQKVRNSIQIRLPDV